MKTRTTTKSIFSILFVLVLFIPISSLSINVNAVISGTNLTIQSNWLYEEKGSFVDIEPHSWENDIKFSIGGEDVLSFYNHGIISANDSEILVRSTVQFGFEVNAYTSVSYTDVFPYINKNKQHSEYFVLVREDPIGANLWKWYYVNWRTIDYGTVHRYHEYDGLLPITVGVKDILPPSGTIDLNGVSFPIPKYTYNMIQIQIDGVRDGEAGAYMDIFTDASEISEGSVSTETLGDDFDHQAEAVIKQVQDWDLGWKAGQIKRGETLQQWEKDTDAVGTTYHFPRFEENTEVEFNLPITLIPQVYEYVQYNHIRKAQFEYWTWGLFAGTIGTVSYGPATVVAPKRIVAVHTNNYFLHWDFIVDVDFYATIPVTAELSESILADPYLKRGDMVWDSSFTGAYDVTLPFTITDPWTAFLDAISGSIGWIVLIVVAIVGVYIFMKIGVPLLMFRARRKSRK